MLRQRDMVPCPCDLRACTHRLMKEWKKKKKPFKESIRDILTPPAESGISSEHEKGGGFGAEGRAAIWPPYLVVIVLFGGL